MLQLWLLDFPWPTCRRHFSREDASIFQFCGFQQVSFACHGLLYWSHHIFLLLLIFDVPWPTLITSIVVEVSSKFSVMSVKDKPVLLGFLNQQHGNFGCNRSRFQVLCDCSWRNNLWLSSGWTSASISQIECQGSLPKIHSQTSFNSLFSPIISNGLSSTSS